MHRRQALIVATGAAVSVSHAAGGRLLHPPPQSHIDPSRWYPLQLLRAALKAANSPLETQIAPDLKAQGRWARELAQGAGTVDVAWFMTDARREAELLPIRIPIFRGLFGWRLLLIHRDHEREWAGVRTLEALRGKILLQGHDWPDTEILRANGLRVETATRQEALVHMLEAGRADAFPRSALEAWAELPHLPKNLMVASGLMLYYPAPMYFFVAPGNQALAQTLALGLERLIRDGLMQQLFVQHHGEDLRRTRASPRTVLRLNNPLLPPQTPLSRPELWESL